MTATILKSPSNSTNANDSAIVLGTEPGNVPVDSVVIVGLGKGAGSTFPIGWTVTDSPGNTYVRRNISNRSSTVETSLFSALVTTLLVGNASIDAYAGGINNRKLIAALMVSGISETPNISSTNTPPASGANNSGINHTTSINTSVTTTVDDCLLVVVVGCSGSSNTCTPNSGQEWTAGPEEHITGSSPRNLFIFYKIVGAAGSYSFTATLGGNAGATTMAAFPILEDVGPAGVQIGNVFDGTLFPIGEAGQIIDGELVPFVEIGQIIGGELVPFAET